MKRTRFIVLIITVFALSLLAASMVSGADKIKKPTGGTYQRPGMEEEDDEGDAGSDEDAFSSSKKDTKLEDDTPQYLDKEIIGNAIKRRYTAIKFCYQKELNRDKNLKGTVVVEFAIQLSGKVDKVKINEKRSTLKKSAVRNCIVDKIKLLEFPERTKGEPQIVTFPFRFDAKQ